MKQVIIILVRPYVCLVLPMPLVAEQEHLHVKKVIIAVITLNVPLAQKVANHAAILHIVLLVLTGIL